MSRGDGRVMRAAQAVIKDEHERLLDSHEVAQRVYGLDSVKDVTVSQSASVRRALRKIWERDEDVVLVNIGGRNGRSKWGRRDVYERRRAEARACIRSWGYPVPAE